MAVIDTAGLFGGKRLRGCSPMARLHWPYLFLLSNGYARIELDFQALSYQFASFGDDAPTSAQIQTYFAEYAKNHLVFLYEGDGQRWAQWDTRRSYLKDFKTASDRKSPHPPEPEYSRWLQEQHGRDWAAYHWDKESKSDADFSETDSAAHADTDALGKSSLIPKNSSPRNRGELPDFQATINRAFALGVRGGDGVGVGVGARNGKGEGPSPKEIRFDETDQTPDDLPNLSLAMHIAETLCLPNTRHLLSAVAESIRTKAKAERITSAAAHDVILRRAALAKKEGVKKPWPFWFSDQEYDRKGEATTQGQNPSPVAAPEPASERMKRQLEAERQAMQKGSGGVSA
jgi:hypothetical protein